MIRRLLTNNVLVTWLVFASALSIDAQAATRFAYTVNSANSRIAIHTIDPTTGALGLSETVATGPVPVSVVVEPSAQFLYVLNAGGSVQAFRINSSTGGLTLIQTLQTLHPTSMVAEPTGQFLYVASSSGVISKFSIRSNGSLLALGPETAGNNVAAMIVHPSARFLYSLDSSGAQILIFSINLSNGDLSLLGSLPSGGSSPGALAIEPKGRYIYVAHAEDNLVTTFRLNMTTGGLSLIQSFAPKNPVALSVEQTARFLYVVSRQNSSVFALAINQSNGTLSNVDTEVLQTSGGDSVSVDPTNRFLYVTSADANRITKLTIDQATGAMTEGPNVSSAGSRPLALAVAHPAERFLYMDGFLGSGVNERLEAFGIGASGGALTPSQNFDLTDDVNEIAIEPTGRFFYVLNRNDRTINAFSIDLSNGQLTPIQTVNSPPGVGGVGGIAVEPTGRFLFVACTCNFLNTRIRIFRIDAITGLLTEQTGGGGGGNLFSQGSAVDLTGRFLYVTSFFDETVEAFSINQSTGAVTAIGSVPLNGQPQRIILDPSGRFVYVPTFNGAAGAPLRAFRISSTGSLIDEGSIELGGGAGLASAVDKTGRFFFAANYSGSVRILLIDQTSGQLSIAPIAPVPIPAAMAGTAEVTGRFLIVGLGVSAPISGNLRTYKIDPATGSITEVSNTSTLSLPENIVTTGRVR